MESRQDYDLVVIGSGPAGQKAAIQAAKLCKRVAIVDASFRIGGACLHDGTIPSKSFREAIVHLSGYRERRHYGSAYRVKSQVEMGDLTSRTSGIVSDVEQTIRAQLIRNNVDIVHGFASLLDPHRVRVRCGNREQILGTESIIIATGTHPWHPPGFEFDGETILDSDSVLQMKRIPRTMSVVGGGIIGCEYGSMFAALGVKVTIVEAKRSILQMVDQELIDHLLYKLREQKVAVIVNDKVTRCARTSNGRAVTYLESGKRVVSDVLLVSAGRCGNIKGLDLDALGIEYTERGNIVVNEHFQTSIPNIYAVGDVVGAPALASTALEQGRRAGAHAVGVEFPAPSSPLAFGIYTIPEIGMVGNTEAELSREKVPYETGIARFSEIDRGKIVGDDSGVLKLLFHRDTLKLLGVHVIGELAAELVHVGQAVMAFEGGIDYLARTIFNFPTLGQAYRVAALDGLNKIVDARGIPGQAFEELKRELELN